jgi:hypothetical protein
VNGALGVIGVSGKTDLIEIICTFYDYLKGL